MRHENCSFFLLIIFLLKFKIHISLNKICQLVGSPLYWRADELIAISNIDQMDSYKQKQCMRHQESKTRKRKKKQRPQFVLSYINSPPHPSAHTITHTLQSHNSEQFCSNTVFLNFRQAMAPTAAMLILGHHTRTVTQASHSPSSKSTPVFLVRSSLAKWVSHCYSMFQQEPKAKESIADLPSSEQGTRYQEKSLN